MRKKCISLILIISLLSAVNMVTYAKETTGMEQESERDIILYMSNIKTNDYALTISASHVATVRCVLRGGSGVTKTTISATLQKKSGSSWSNVQTFNASSNSSQVSLKKTRGVVAGGNYRVKVTFRAYKGSNAETKTLYTPTKKG